MSDYNNILAQIGGALSAQATGGSQGLQAYMAQLAGQQSQDIERRSRSFEAQMARMAKRQSDAASRQHAREQQSRDQAFQKERDTLNRAHDLELEQLRQGKEDRSRRERDELVAGGVYNYAMSSPEAQEAVMEQMYRTVNELTIDGERVPLDFTNRDEVMPFVTAAVMGGFTVQQAQDVGQASGERADWYQSAYGDRDQTPSGPNATAQYAKDRSQYTATNQKLDSFKTSVGSIMKAANELEQRSAKISPTEYHEEAVALAKRLGELGVSVEALRDENPFVQEGAGLFSVADEISKSIASVGDTIYKDQQAKGAAVLGAWSPENPDQFPGFMAGFGGGSADDPEGEEFNWLLSQESFTNRLNPEWSEKLTFLDSLGPDDLQYLDPEQQALYRRMKQERADRGEGQVYDLGTALRDRRASTEQDRTTEVDSIIRGVHQLDPRRIMRNIQSKRGEQSAVEGVQRFGRTLNVNNALGFPLFQSQEEARQALALYGETNELGFKQMPDDTDVFLADFVASDAGMTRIADGLLDNVMGDGPMPADIGLERMLKRGDYALQRLNVATQTNRDRLRAMLQSRTGQMATIEASGGPAQQIHNFPFPTEGFSPGANQDYGDYVDDDELAKWEKKFESDFFSTPVNVDDAFNAVSDTFRKMREARSPFVQDWAWPFTSLAKFPRMRLAGEEASAETSNVGTFYDLFDLFRDNVPVFAEIAAKPGRVRQHATAKGHYVVENGRRRHVPQYKSWAARGDAASMIRGKDSFASQYARSTSEDERDENLVNMLGYIDFMRGYDLRGDIGDLTPEMRKVLVGVQTHLRGLDMNGVVAAIGGPNPTGFSFEDLGLAVASPETATAEAAAVGGTDLAEMAINPEQILEDIRQARRDKAFLQPGQAIDADPNPSKVDYAIATDVLLAEDDKRLDTAEAQALVMLDARNYPDTQETGQSLADVILSAPMGSPEDLQNAVNGLLPAIAGITIDEIALERTGAQALTERISSATNARTALSKTLDVLKFSNYQTLQSRAMSLSSTAPMASRNMIIHEKLMRLKQIEREVAVIKRGIMSRRDPETGKFDIANIPPALRPALENTNYRELAESGDLDKLGYLAMQMWAARKQMAED